MGDGRVGVGIVGLGTIALAHEIGYRDLPDTCEIVAVCDVDAKTAAQRAAAHGARAFTRYQDLLADPDIDAVDVIVPHDRHHEVVTAALDAGKHVLVEKPIAVDSARGREMIDRARSSGVTFTVAENTRYVSAYQAAERLLREGALGDVRSVRTLIAGSEVPRIRDPAAWHGKAPHGGVLLDSAVHSLYLLRWLFGGVRDVRAFASTLIPESEVEDNALLIGRLAGGGEYQVHVSCTMEIPWTERLEVYGCEGSVVVDQLADPVMRYYRGEADLEGVAAEAVPHEPLLWKLTSVMAEVRDFVEAVLEGRAPLVDPEDALYSLQVAETAYLSVGSGHPEPVR